MNKEWLKQQVAEEEFISQSDRVYFVPLHYGYFNPQREKMNIKVLDRNELWKFSSQKETWLNNKGRAEICIALRWQNN